MRTFRSMALLLLVVGLLAGCASPAAEPAAEVEEVAEQAAVEVAQETEAKTMILATTTSTDDSGLLKYILPDFTEKTGILSKWWLSVPGGAQLGIDGNADVLLVHDRAREDAYMADGHGTRREDVMYNDCDRGSESDPAGIAGTTDVAAAFARSPRPVALYLPWR